MDAAIRRALKDLEGRVKLCPDYGSLLYNPEANAFHLCTSDGDSEEAVRVAVAAIREIVGDDISAEAEYTPQGFTEEIACYGSRDWSGADAVIDPRAHAAATSPLNDLADPTERQKEAGTYRKGHLKIGDLSIAIENPSGSRRRPEWPPLSDHYGYIKGTVGYDKDHLDVFVKPGTEDSWRGSVYVVNQLSGGAFDEHKCMLGWGDSDSALAGYLSNYSGGQAANVGSIVPLAFDAFASWARDRGDTGPAAGLLGQPEAKTNGIPTTEDVRRFHSELKIQIGQDDETFSDSVAAEDSEVLVADGLPSGVLMRRKQLAAEADKANKNRRRYPKRVIESAIDAASERIRAGVMISEFEHPEAVSACDRGRCGDHYIDDPESKTARIVEILKPDAQGRIYIVRDILDTPAGRKVAEAINAKRPFGISTRWKMRGLTTASDGIQEPSWLYISTFDDVRIPAVEGAGACADSLGDPFGGAARNTLNPEDPRNPDPEEELDTEGDSPTDHLRQGAHQQNPMNKKEILRQLRALQQMVASGACPDDIAKADKAVGDTILAAYRDGEEVSDLIGLYKAAVPASDSAQIAGYHSGMSPIYTVMGNELGSDPTSGWAPDVRTNGNGQSKLLSQKTDPTPEALKPALNADEMETVRNMATQERVRQAEKARVDSVTSKLETLVGDSHPLLKLPESVQKTIRESVVAHADSEKEVEALLNDHIAIASAASAQAKLEADGLRTSGRGNTVNDPANATNVQVTREALPGWDKVEKLIAATDEFRAALPSSHPDYINPSAPGAKERRKRNREKMMPILEQAEERRFGSGAMQTAFGDSLASLTDEQLFAQIQKDVVAGDAYSTVVGSLLNQPTIFRYLFVQAYQDMRMLQFCQAMGPGQEAGNGLPGWEQQSGLGRVFKVPSETYSDPSNFGFQYGSVDMGLLFAANAGIDEGTVKTYWDSFFPQLRQIATSQDYQSIKAMGNGPLNYPVVARNLFHMAARKARTIDKALADEQPNIALEYGAVAVSAESYTTGNSRLPNNSVFPAAGAVTVNLNPTKTAVTAVASTDKSVTYGTGNATGGAAVTAAIRLLCGTSGTFLGTTIYCSNNIYGPTPVVPPRSQLTLTGPGADSTSTLNTVAVSAPAAAVLGVLGPDGNIYSYPGTTATYAVDYINGVLVFASGVTGAAGIMTTTTTLSYSYATNWDYFVSSPNMVSLASGETALAYYSKLLVQIDSTAANMGSWPKFVAPDLGLMSLNTSVRITEATQFYKLNSPDGTELFPDETNFARRNGVDLARLNTPWWVGDNAIVLTRSGSTKYAVDTPFEVKGPFTKYDSSGRMIAGEGYYGVENSAIFTPQVKDSTGAILNPVGRMIVLY